MPKPTTIAAAFSDKPYTAIPMAPVSSHQVAAIGYDPTTKILAVTFTRGVGAIYQYPGVEPQTHADFLAAESKGRYFDAHIKALPFDKFAPPKAEEPAGEPEPA